MYGIRFSDNIPEPKPATADRIVAAHYYAAWKKGAAGLHDGFNDLHDFPERTPLMGYYDEENPEVCDWEIKWATEHGINCFIYCWYRKKDNYKKPVTVNDLRCGHGLHEALFNAKFQKMMKFAIMFEASPIWGGTDEEDIASNLMPFWTETYFKRENYLIIDNKPVLFVFCQNRLETECFPEPEQQKRAFDACRKYAKACGFDGMIFAPCVFSSFNGEEYNSLLARGYDFVFGYNSGYTPNHTPENDGEIIEAQSKIFEKRLGITNGNVIPTASCFYDAEPRKSQRWIDMGYRFDEWNKYPWYLSPEGYRQLLHRMKTLADSAPKNSWASRILMIDNWNEWDEGHFVAPSHQFGFRYLQAIREELTARDNLPDYRTPQDLGFDGYNKSWETPDFSEICKKKFNLK